MFYRRKFVAFSHPNSFLRESGKLYVLYMVAGVAAIPAGILYAILAVKGYGGWWSALAAIALGFWMAKEAWSYVERKLFAPAFSSSASGASATWSLGQVPAVAVVAIVLSLSPVAPFTRPIPITPQQPTGAGTVVTISADQPEQFTEQSVLTYEHGA